MARYYIDTFNRFAVLDDEGYELRDLGAASAVVRETLAAMMRDEGDKGPIVDLHADVRDASGRRVLTASLRMVIETAA